MSGLSVERHVHVSAPAVWDRVTDLGSSPQVLSAIDRVEHVEGPFPRIGVGTVWDETRTMMGRSETQRMRCTAIDEQAMRYVVEADGHGAHYESVMTVVAEGADACTLGMTFDAQPQSMAAKVLGATVGRLLLGATRRSLEVDLADIATAASA